MVNMMGTQNRTFTKNDTLLAKGIAMILMVVHHMMGSSSPNMDPLASVTLFGEVNALGVFIARFGKICVAMFTLLSGYGLCHSITKMNHSMENGGVLLRRIGKLYLSYWKAFLMFLVIKWLATGRLEVDAYALLTDSLGLTYNLCGAWWFFMPYVLLVAMYPVFDRFLRRVKGNLTIDCFWVFVLWTFACYCYPEVMNLRFICNFSASNPIWWQFYWVINLAPAFLLGGILAKYDVLSRIYTLLEGKWIALPVYASMWVLAFVFRSSYGNEPETKMPEFLFAALLICGGVGIVRRITGVRSICKAIGRESTNMWLLHAVLVFFFIQNPAISFVGVFRNPLVQLVMVLAGSYLLSKLTDALFHQLHKAVMNAKEILEKRRGGKPGAAI